MMRLSSELPPVVFRALLDEYQWVLRDVLERSGGRDVDVDDDTAAASFSTAGQAALAALAAQGAVAEHDWPHGRKLAMSVGLHSGLPQPAASRCAELCDAAEGGQIFLSQEVSVLLGQEKHGEFSVRDLGEVPLRKSDRSVRAYELIGIARRT